MPSNDTYFGIKACDKPQPLQVISQHLGYVLAHMLDDVLAGAVSDIVGQLLRSKQSIAVEFDKSYDQR